MTTPSVTTTNSRSLLAERVNAEALLTSEELFDYFARVQALVGNSLRVITKATPAIAYTVLEIGSEVTAKLQRNKSLFRRRVEYDNDVLKDAAGNADVDTDVFLCQCFDLARDITLGRDVSEHVENMRLSRMYAERFVRAWLIQAESYETKVWAVAAAFNHEDLANTAYVNAATELLRTQHEGNIPEYEGYGLVRWVRAQVQAIDHVYERITKAYARVILKLAKGNSIDDDHFLELFQFGYFGLARANSTYDYVLNAKYVAVAKWWVRQSIMYHMKASSGMIKISPALWQHRARYETARQKILTQKGSATYEDVAAALGVNTRTVESVYDSVRTAQVGVYDVTVHDDGVDAPVLSTTHDAIETLSCLPAQSQAYLALLYGMPEIVVPVCAPEDAAWHKIRQGAAKLLIAEA